jgi:pyridoxine 4-dehydrogenase
VACGSSGCQAARVFVDQAVQDGFSVEPFAVEVGNGDVATFVFAIGDALNVQNPLNLVDRVSVPVLRECTRRDIAFVPFFPLGSAFARTNPVLGNKHVISISQRLSHTPAQVALAWLLGLAPNVLLIPGTSSLRHLEENLAVADVTLDEDAQQQLTAIAA